MLEQLEATSERAPKAVAADLRGSSSRPGRRRAKARSWWKRGGLTKLLFLAPVVIYLPIFFAYPIYYSVRVSLEDFTITSAISGVAQFVGIANLRSVLDNPVTQEALEHTAIFVASSIIAQYMIGMMLALLFNTRFKLNGTLRALILLPWLLPSVVSVTAWSWLFNQTNGMIDTVLMDLHLTSTAVPWLSNGRDALIAVILVNIWIGIPFNMLLLHSGMQGIPTNLYEAAKLDGASRASQFRYVTFPQLMPVTRVIFLLGTIYTLKQFDIIYILTNGGPGTATQLLSTWAYSLSFTDFNFGQGAALGDIIFLIALVIGLFYVIRNRQLQVKDAR